MADFDEMQNQAVKSALEMQKRAINNENNRQQTPFCKGACPIKNILSPPKGEPDNDIILLLALLLMLSGDGGDRMLLLALLYIMT
ncbi:MAG: hypothetical protein KBT46_08275 [Ruminococcus sp.]|nr:hypothetical protein [Candidatus Copronaster equi]